MTRQFQITVDAADPQALGLFWAEALGYMVDPPPGGQIDKADTTIAAWDRFLEDQNVPVDQRKNAFAVIDPERYGPRIFLQRTNTPKSGTNRLHLDVRVAPGLADGERMAALEAECHRLVGLGATRLQRIEPEPPLEFGVIVMADPEGNEFCLA
ncbi:MAG: glyoxalase [Micrococcales bacterium]|nr:MAG: glyoxalase [Micrococcales bacterium]